MTLHRVFTVFAAIVLMAVAEAADPPMNPTPVPSVECLKCHVANRTSLEDRVAAIEISMPVKPAVPSSTP